MMELSKELRQARIDKRASALKQDKASKIECDSQRAQSNMKPFPNALSDALRDLDEATKEYRGLNPNMVVVDDSLNCNQTSDKYTFSSGAKRSSVKPKYDSIPLPFLQMLTVMFSEGIRLDLITPDFYEGMGKVITEGAIKYGEDNWQKGGIDFMDAAFNHAIEHLYKWRSGDRTEPHLFNVACNLMFIDHISNCTVKTELDDMIEAVANTQSQVKCPDCGCTAAQAIRENRYKCFGCSGWFSIPEPTSHPSAVPSVPAHPGMLR